MNAPSRFPLNRLRSNLAAYGRELWFLRRGDPQRWMIAGQASVSLVVPPAALMLAGIGELAFQSAVGSFVGLYLTQHRARRRVATLPFVAAGLIAAAVAGVLCASSIPLTMLGLVIVATIASAAVYSCALGPPGPLFFVLIYGLSARIAASGSSPALFIAAVSGGAAFAVLVAAVPLLWERSTRSARPVTPALVALFTWSPETRILFTRATIAAAVGTVVGAVVDPGRAYWIVGSGLAVIGVSVTSRAQLTRAASRVMGTLVGAGVYAILSWLHATGSALLGILAVLQFGVEMLIVRNYTWALALITPLVLLLTSAAVGSTAPITAERVLDVVLGSVVGAATVFYRRSVDRSFLTARRPTPSPRRGQ